MSEPITYSLDHSTSSVNLSLADERLICKTQGKGVLDKLKLIDIPLSDLKQFCLVPTISVQNLKTYGNEGDYSYDSEFIFSYIANGKLTKKRVFVNSQDEPFRRFLENLQARCPNASLLHLEPAEAQKQIGTMSASKAVYIVVGLLVGIPIILTLIFIISKVLSGK